MKYLGMHDSNEHRLPLVSASTELQRRREAVLGDHIVMEVGAAPAWHNPCSSMQWTARWPYRIEAPLAGHSFAAHGILRNRNADGGKRRRGQ